MYSTVSVVVPVYQGEAFISQCLDSIQKQTYRDIEVLLVDDGSMDNSPDMSDEFAISDPRVVVIHKMNQGVADSRNKGLEIATGDNLCFIDSDDLISEYSLEKLVDCLKNSNLALFQTVCFRDENPIRYEVHQVSSRSAIAYLQHIIENDLFLCACEVAFRRHLIEQNHLRFTLDRRAGEDQEFVYKYLTFCQTVAYTDAEYWYRIGNPNSAMHTLGYRHFDAIDAMLDVDRFAKNRIPKDEYLQMNNLILSRRIPLVIQFCCYTVLTAGEKPKRLFAFLKEKGYHQLVVNALSQPTHYDSAFFTMYRFSPMFCFCMVAARKAIGRILRKWKLIQ